MSAATPDQRPDSNLPRARSPLTVDAIVDTACRIVETEGLARLSMRRLGGALGVDPMAVYHHVAGKRALLALVTERTIGRMALPDTSASWDARVREWALAYWELVIANRELTLAGLADPEIAAGGLPSTAPLLDAVEASGLAAELVEPAVYVVVDAVHGAALGAGAPRRHDRDDVAVSRAVFEAGLDTIVAGIAARAGVELLRSANGGNQRG